MTRRPNPSLIAALLLASFAFLLPPALDAQVRRGRQPEPQDRWPPISIGARAGWDQRANGSVLGGQLRVPVLRSGQLELLPNAEIVFLNQGAKEYQYNLEATYVPGGPRGGVWLGGGIGWRTDTVLSGIGDDPDAENDFFGYVLSVGGKTAIARLELELALRWVFLNDTDYRPNAATLGLNFPLWTVPRR